MHSVHRMIEKVIWSISRSSAGVIRFRPIKNKSMWIHARHDVCASTNRNINVIPTEYDIFFETRLRFIVKLNDLKSLHALFSLNEHLDKFHLLWFISNFICGDWFILIIIATDDNWQIYTLWTFKICSTPFFRSIFRSIFKFSP